MNGKRKYYPYIINVSLKTNSLPKEVWLNAELESFYPELWCLQHKTVTFCAKPVTLGLLYRSSWSFWGENKINLFNSVSMALYRRISILHIGYIMLSLKQLKHFCYVPSLSGDCKLGQKSEAIFIAWMMTFIKPDQLPQIWESSVFHVADR